MKPEEIISRTEEFVKGQLENDSTGHDWWHIHRVRNLAMVLAKEEKANLLIVELGALLHDIADHKFHGGDAMIGPAMARSWLSGMSVDKSIIDAVVEIVQGVSYKGAGVETPMQSIEGKVVQDADRIDALGAIGIARTFAYGGYKGHGLYDPEIEPVMHDSFESYKKSKAPTINHFYEKLLLLKDRMNTDTGRKIANERHLFMEEYLQRFFAEWEGKQ